MKQLTITAPDDWHLHFRDGALLQTTVPATARCFKRAIVMPNLNPPVLNAQDALAYRARILTAARATPDFNPLMTLYLSDTTTPAIIREAISAQIPAAKLYPAGATTNSSAGVNTIDSLYAVFETMSEVGMRLLIHGEVTDDTVDIFDREARFIEQYLVPIQRRFTDLKIVLEHITTRDAADFVLGAGSNIAATITPQHLLLNRNDLFVGGIRPHHYCLPILKRNTHQTRLQEVVASGSAQFFLGTDSAPHSRASKETACGCAGCYSAPSAIELYAQVFDQLNALDKLEAFASHHGPDFYGLARNTSTLTLQQQPWQIPEQIETTNGDSIVPLMAGQWIDWQVAVSNRD